MADILERGTLQRTPITRPVTSNCDINEVNSFHMEIGLRWKAKLGDASRKGSDRS